MNLYKTIIIDDESLAIDVIEHHLKRFPEFEVINTFTDSVAAFNFLKEGSSVDLVFTDIAMPEISGMELVNLFQSKAKFIMTTSYTQYAVESFDLEVVDYLLKPISFERFCKAINRFESSAVPGNQYLAERSFFVKEGEEFIKILVNDIDYIEGLKDYVKIITGKNYCLALKSLKSIEAVLSPYKFMRIHKSYVVPLAKISQYNGNCVIINNAEVPVGSTYREALKAYLNRNRL
jgi:DNA-binding LytR/AlgR family response regulator